MSQIRERAFYVYGFTRTATHILGSEEDAELVEGDFGEGFDKADAPHLWHGRGGISAIVCMVDHDDFVRQPGDYRMTNLTWIASRVVKHQAVLEKAMNAGPILPLHFGTLFASEEMLEGFLSRHSRTISRFLSRMETCQEWTLQGYCDTSECEKSIRAGFVTEEGVPDGTNPFAEALLDKLREREVKKMTQEWIETKCKELFDSIVPLSVNSSERRLLPHDGHPESCEMVANWALLISKDQIADFQRLVDRISTAYATQGLTFHLSGPWPPFSFCPALDEDTMDD